MKILVTGGAGFIGSNLIDHLLIQNHSVVCLDNFSTGSYKNIDQHIKDSRFKLIEGDIRDIADCHAAVKGCDVITHQAALGSVPRSIADPLLTNEVNINGFINMLVAARDEGIERFVYAASSSTYGDSVELPKREMYIGKPLSPYSVTKYVNELYADVFSKLFKMHCIGLRYFNVFGKRQDPNGAYSAVIPNWVKTLASHERPQINGDGFYSRDFTHISNVLHANDRALFTSIDDLHIGVGKYNNELLPNEKGLCDTLEFSKEHGAMVFNIALGNRTTLISLFMMIRKILSNYDPLVAQIEPKYGVSREGDVPHSEADIQKAKIILKYSPVCEVEKGMEDAIGWYYRTFNAKD
jgi:UDP-N-acetylglucosamine/UDP-N-acetylgalactosamine 4-epimerase